MTSGASPIKQGTATAVVNPSTQTVGTGTSADKSFTELPTGIKNSAVMAANTLAAQTPQAARDNTSSGSQSNVDPKMNEVDEKITNAAVKNS